jgi:predicted nucleic acid-binding protein
MPEAISNTSPLLYLYRIGVLQWLHELFDQVWLPEAVALELRQGQEKGYDVPNPEEYAWFRRMEPTSVPSEWLALDLGPGEFAAMTLALEHPDHPILLDDALARRVAKAAGLDVWGTLRILLEAKSRGWTPAISPHVNDLEKAGMWLSPEIRRRILSLAGE